MVLVQPIKCPKVLRFLNSRLPKPTDNPKKTVCFAHHEGGKTEKENHLHMRRIRSEKVIKWQEEEAPKAPRNLLKLPSVVKEPPQRPLTTGLHFSAKKVTMA